MAVAFSLRTLSNDMGVLFISWPVTGAWPGARVAGLHGSAGFWEEAGRHHYEKEAGHTGSP